jgi:ParB/RepB/Spo0J family partition protein
MSKSRKTSAAIVGLLDAIKSEGIEPVDDTSIMASKLGTHATKNSSVTISNVRTDDEAYIPYQIKLLEPKHCRPWHLANRLSEYLTPESCADLIESIQKVGQQIPALVRKSDKWEGYDLICGARRLFACEHLGIKIKAAIVSLSDKEALLAMDAENRPREDISPYERACDYKRWVDMGIYKNYTEIMQSIGVKKSWFSQLMALADLNEDIVKAFGHPANLKQKWGYELQLVCKKDIALEAAMLNAAREVIGQPIPPASIFKKLKNVRINDSSTIIKKPIWITDNAGKKIFKIRYSKSGRVQVSFNRRLPEKLIDQIVNNAKLLIDGEENEKSLLE